MTGSARGSYRRTVFVAVATCAAAVLAGWTAAQAQIIFGGFRGGSLNWAAPEDFDGTFHYCRGFYRSVYA